MNNSGPHTDILSARAAFVCAARALARGRVQPEVTQITPAAADVFSFTGQRSGSRFDGCRFNPGGRYAARQ